MARPKSYNRDEAIERACMAFWEHGYRALGVRELEKLTGLNQFAIRTEFGGKEGLYLEALRLYGDQAIASAMQPLTSGKTPEIIAFLHCLVTDGSETSSKWGCLIVNTGIENARIGSLKLEKAVQRYWLTLEKSFIRALKNASNAGELEAETNPKVLARGLVTAVMGVHTINRTKGENKAGKALVEVICGHLKSLEAK